MFHPYYNVASSSSSSSDDDDGDDDYYYYMGETSGSYVHRNTHKMSLKPTDDATL